MAFGEIFNDRKLISLVEEYPNLYNKRDKTYKDDIEKEKSWKNIATQMLMDVSIVKRRWHNLRDRFVRSYRNYTNNVSSSVDVGKGIKFPLFFQMMWLSKFIRKRKIMSYYNSNTSLQHSQSSSTSESNKCDDLYNDDSSKTSQDEDPINIKVEYLSKNTKQEPILGLNSAVGESSELSCKKIKTDISYDSNYQMMSESPILKILDKMLYDGTDISDFNFMMSIVSDMKNLNKQVKMKFKREVLELLEKYID